jgi:endonuclease/exonuclease/phosphatase (EEP) superfamily protein YafD
MGREQTTRQVLAKIWIGMVALGIALVGVAFAGGPERHSVVAYLQYLPYLVYLLPAAVAALVSVRLGWRWRLVALSTLGLVLTEIMGLSIGRPDEGSGHLRFMTYNAKATYALDDPQGLGKLAQEIMANDPDVLVMQDAGEFMSVKAQRPEAFAALVGKRDVYAFGQYIVASRLPMRDCAPGFIPFSGRRHTFVHCVLTAHGKDIDLVTVHFLTPRSGLNAVRHAGARGLDEWRTNMTDRLTQSSELAQQLAQMKRPRIVAGDLNAPERSNVVRNLLSTGLRDAFSSAGFGYGFTHGHSLKPWISFLRIDHILVSDDIGVVDAYAGGSKGSQHRPVIADLRVNREAE